nr:hypothetical protein [Tanacetum cinerariifolium]
MSDSTGVSVSLGEMSLEGNKYWESNIGDSDNTRDGDKIAGRVIITWGGEMVSYACMTSIFESSCKGKKTSMSKRYLVKLFEELGEMLPGKITIVILVRDIYPRGKEIEQQGDDVAFWWSWNVFEVLVSCYEDVMKPTLVLVKWLPFTNCNSNEAQPGEHADREQLVNSMDKGKGQTWGADDDGLIEVKKKKSSSNNEGNKNFKPVSVKPKTQYRPKAKQSTEAMSNCPKTTPFVGTNKASTSCYNKESRSNKCSFFSLSNSFEALNVYNPEEVTIDSSNSATRTPNVLNASLESFPTLSEAHGIHSPASANEENTSDVGPKVGPTPSGNTFGLSSYANVTSVLCRKALNFRTLFTPAGNRINVVVPVESI